MSKPIARIALRGDVPRDLFWLLPLLKLDPLGVGGLDADLVVSFSAFDATAHPAKSPNGWLLGVRSGGLGSRITDGEVYCSNMYVAASLILSRAVGLAEPLLAASNDTFTRLSEAVAIEPASNVLIEGETGSGKLLLAQLIHRSIDAMGELLRVDCAVPEEIERELRSAEQERATVPHTPRTVLLEHLPELPIEHQRRLAERLATPSRVRYLATAKPGIDGGYGRSIPAMLARHFAQVIKIAPLRRAPDDLNVLANHFLRLADPALAFDLNALATLRNYRFPGNVRELRNFITRLHVYEHGRAGRLIRREQVERLLTRSSAAPASTPIKRASGRLALRASGRRSHLRLVSNR